jgi:hypothetical protein
MFLFHCAFDRQDDHELNTYFGSFLTKEFDEHKKNVWGVEKFDIVMGNPPFQKTESDDKRTYPLWDEFVDKSISLLNINGFLNFIHPGAWRNAKGHFKKTQKLLRTKTFLILKMFNSKKGKEIFNKLVSCDYYCLQNKINDNEKTIITFEDGITLNIDISKLEAIPSAKYQEINSIISKENQDKVEVLYSRSNYGHDSRNISNVETDTHIYPVIYTIKKNGEKRLIWSNTNKNGHFGIPKVIWSNGASFPIIDFTGEYGVSDYSYSIVDKPENLERICKAMKSKKFLSYMEVAEGPGQSGIYKHRIISLFIKDFYKQFIDENGNEI